MRTHISIAELGKKAECDYKNSRRAVPTPVRGMKGVSVLSSAPQFDMARGTIVDNKELGITPFLRKQ